MPPSPNEDDGNRPVERSNWFPEDKDPRSPKDDCGLAPLETGALRGDTNGPDVVNALGVASIALLSPTPVLVDADVDGGVADADVDALIGDADSRARFASNGVLRSPDPDDTGTPGAVLAFVSTSGRLRLSGPLGATDEFIRSHCST